MSAFEITVFGLVQGVGFRPFVAEYAEEHGLSGSINNSGGVVKIYIECSQEEIGALTYHLRYNCPKGGRVDNIVVKPVDHVIYDEETSEMIKSLEESAKRVEEVERAVEAVEAERTGESIGEALLEEEKSFKQMILDKVKKASAESPEEPLKDNSEVTSEMVSGDASDESAGDASDAKASDESDDVDEDVAEGVVLDIFGREIDDRFRIIKSDNFDEGVRFLPPDIAVCPNCEKELLDPENRRYRYPFISCSLCGPRYSITRTVPYDRENSTMAGFEMCPDCARDYHEPGNPRRFCQTIGCKNCGPKLRFYENRMVDEVYLSQDEMIDRTIDSLRAGKIGAIKDIGGFHFVFVPDNEEAAERLRDFKDNVKRPFSMLFPDIETIKKYCVVSEMEEELLKSNARPIVLLDKTPEGEEISRNACLDSDRIGVMLPCDPLQIILVKEMGPLVITSGNRGGEPIIINDMDMIGFLPRVEGASISTDEVSAVSFADDNINKEETTYTGSDDDSEQVIDFMLTNTREISTPLDDSIVQVAKIHIGSRVKEQVQVIRRARGYIPEPVLLEAELPKETFAAGTDIKSVFALGKKNAVYLSENYEDISDPDTAEARAKAIDYMEELLNVHPKRFLGDNNPNYTSARDADERAKNVYIDGIPQRISRRQHHAAHILSVAAEHGLKGRLLGVAFDGMGYGLDDTIWGSEFISCVLNSSAEEEEKVDQTVETKPKMLRVGALLPVKLIGDDHGSRDTKTTLCGYLKAIEERQLVSHEVMDKILRLLDIGKADYGIISACLKADINTYYSASMGRLFDAVAALLGVCLRNSYNGESPIRLETAAMRAFSKKDGNPFVSDEGLKMSVIEPRDEEEIYRMDQSRLVADIMYRVLDIFEKHPDEEELSAEVDELAYEFHRAIVEASVYICDMVCSRDYIHHIALSGGSMYNRLLVDGILGSLETLGYGVYINNTVPCGDGGVCLGQIYGDVV